MCSWTSIGTFLLLFFFFKQKTAYEMRISDWSSDVCSSDLGQECRVAVGAGLVPAAQPGLRQRAEGLVQRSLPQRQAMDRSGRHGAQARAGAGIDRKSVV